MNILETALYWTQEVGISICPLLYKSKIPDGKALKKSGFEKCNGKGTWLPLKEVLPTESQVRQWFSDGKPRNLAVVTGWQNLVVIDFDDMDCFANWFCWHDEFSPQYLDTFVTSTSRGLHYYYFVSDFINPIKSLIPYEVKSHGRLITIPPSVHPSGTPYQAINSPDSILTVDSIKDVLTFSPVEIKRPVVKKSPWEVKLDSEPVARINLLDLFPEARETSEGYYICNCPIHGHHNNFMLNIKDRVAYCYAGCGTFLFSELVELIGDRNEHSGKRIC